MCSAADDPYSDDGHLIQCSSLLSSTTTKCTTKKQKAKAKPFLSSTPMEKALCLSSPYKPTFHSKPTTHTNASFSLDTKLLHLSSQNMLKEAIFTLQQQQQANNSIKPKTYISLLQSCADLGSVDLARQLHSLARLLPTTADCFVKTKLVSTYAKCRSLEDARRVFDEMPERNLITWSAMIGGYVREERWREAVRLFYLMMHEGVTPDSFLLPRIAQACAAIGDYKTGKLLHSIAEKKGFFDPSVDTHVANSILAMYFKSGDVKNGEKFFWKLGYKDLVSWNSMLSGLYNNGKQEEAIRVFDMMLLTGLKPDIFTWNIYLSNIFITAKSEDLNFNIAIDLIGDMERQGISPNVFSYTSLISGFIQNNKCADALQLFDEMLNSKVDPNSMTVACAISACATLRLVSKGKLLHSYGIKRGIDRSVLLANSLIDMYAKCAMLEDAQKVFDVMPERDIVSWNSIIGGYAHAGCYNKAFEMFSLMDKLGFRRNAVTWNAIIAGFFQNGEVDEALHLICRMEVSGVARNLASWNTVIAGMAQNGHADKALSTFRQMQSVPVPVRPNSVTFLSLVPALETLVCSSKVKEAHCFTIRTGVDPACTPVKNALIWTYAKSGDLNSALTLFHSLPIKTLISWNCMIKSCVYHGRARTVLDLFREMRLQGVTPDHTTVSSVITAYGIEGLVKEGEDFFRSLPESYRVKHTTDHFADMISLYGKAGRLSDARDLFNKMPIEPDEKVWNAVLKAAGMSSDLEFTIYVAENLLNIESWNPQIIKVLYNLYKLAGISRNTLIPENDGGLHGCCYSEFRNKVRCFLTGDLHSDTKIGKIIQAAIDSGLEIAQVSSLLDYGEDREENGTVHSEKKAIAFQILNSNSTRKTIRIIKNGRVCAHCHTFAKLVSKLHKREILIKDSSCLHRFEEGECSCRDYW